MATPIKPTFIKEHEQQKQEQEQAIQKEQQKQEKLKQKKEKQIQRDKEITNKSTNKTSEEKKKNKIIIPVIIGVIVFLGGLIGTFILTTRQTNQLENTQETVTAGVQDVSAQIKQEKEESSEGLYQKEADAIWNKYQNNFTCNENTFKSQYIQLRRDGSSKSDAFKELDNMYGKVEAFNGGLITTSEVEEDVHEVITESENEIEEVNVISQKENEIKQVPTSDPVKAQENKSAEAQEIEELTNIEGITTQEKPESSYYEDNWTYEDETEIHYDAGWGGNVVDISSEDFSDCIGINIE